MDLPIVYPDSIPLDSDILNLARSTMKQFGHLGLALFGVDSVAAGLDAAPASPPSLNVRVGPGMVTQYAAVDATPYGSLPADNNQTVKLGTIDTTTTFPVVAPTTAGRTVCYLIQAAYDQQDTENKVLPYFNAANIEDPFAGPNDSGTAQPTVRKQGVALQAKRGTEAATGSETVPAVSAGYVPLWIVRVAYGQTTVTAAHITAHPDAPWTSKLTDKFAPINSPLFTGNPRAPAPTTADSIATKGYADSILSGAGVSTAADPNTIAKRTSAGALVATAFVGKADTAGAADTAATAGHASTASHADQADHAGSADSATTAANATNAQNAVNATNAQNATTAVSAGNAAKLDNKLPSVVTAADTVVVRDPAGNISANVFNGRASSANYADFAERFEASEPMEAGDVVAFGGDKEICKATSNTIIFGVVSSDPAYLANAGSGDNETHPPVALMGRVPVKCLGPAKKGNVLVMSTIAGVAFAMEAAAPEMIIGRCLEDREGDDVGLVLAFVKAHI